VTGEGYSKKWKVYLEKYRTYNKKLRCAPFESQKLGDSKSSDTNGKQGRGSRGSMVFLVKKLGGMVGPRF
jgi:hypothetical protein